MFTVAPDLDLSAVFRFGDFAAKCGGRLLSPATPRALRAEDVVKTRDPDLDAVVAHKGHVRLESLYLLI